MTSTLLIVLAAMCWGSDLLLRPHALGGGWSPAQVVLGEHVLLTLAFAPVLWRERAQFRHLSRRQWAALFAVSWGGSALATWLYTQSFTLGSPLTSVLLQKTQPVFALLGAGWVLKERRTEAFWPLCAIALVGAVLLSGITVLPSSHDLQWRQALCALGAAALWGGATVAGRLLSGVLSPGLLSGARFALAVPLLALFALLSPAFGLTGRQELSPFIFLLLIVLLPDLLGMTLYYKGLRRTSASVATLAELCYPLTSLLLGLGLMHARLSLGQWVGLVQLTFAVLLLARQPQIVRLPVDAQPVPG